MKKLFIVANWKSNKSILQAEEWIRTFNNSLATFNKEKKEIVICPPFTLLSVLKSYILNHKLPIQLGAQDISSLSGACTGGINGKQIKELADYVLIGHSERRTNFGETDETIFEKFKLAKEDGLAPIFCVQGKETKIPQGVEIVAFEPITAIGTGNPDTPENAEDVASYFKANFQVGNVLYGGSVTSDNVNSFTQMPDIDGVLVGKASLDAKEFYEIIKNS